MRRRILRPVQPRKTGRSPEPHSFPNPGTSIIGGMYRHRRQEETSLNLPRTSTSGKLVKAGSRLPQMTPITNQFHIWNSDDSMPMKEGPRLEYQRRKLFHDRSFDRHEVAIGWRSSKAMGSSGICNRQQLSPMTLSKNALSSANDHNKNHHACHQRCPLLVTTQEEKRQQQSIAVRINQQFLNYPSRRSGILLRSCFDPRRSV